MIVFNWKSHFIFFLFSLLFQSLLPLSMSIFIMFFYTFQQFDKRFYHTQTHLKHHTTPHHKTPHHTTQHHTTQHHTTQHHTTPHHTTPHHTTPHHTTPHPTTPHYTTLHHSSEEAVFSDIDGILQGLSHELDQMLNPGA